MMLNKRKINTKKIVRVSYDDIVKDPNPILREVSKEVSWPLSKDNVHIMNQMIDYVRSSQNEEEAKSRNLRSAYGISAVQLGHALKMMYVRIERSDGFGAEEFALINPRLKDTSSKKCALESGEGCLSIKEDVPGYVVRPYTVTLVAIDHFTDREIEITAHGITAIVLQHELDHLSGVLYYDRINKLAPDKIESNVKLI